MPIDSWSALIVAHAAAAFLALGLGAMLLAGTKGTRSHRRLGWWWVALMAVVAISSFGIFRDAYSWIHGLSVFTLLVLALAVFHARAGHTHRHRRTMQGLYFGALVLTGMFTLLPDRLIVRTLAAWAGG